ncbi:MAG: aspartate ammonia-lyase [Syntrophales bacterium]
MRPTRIEEDFLGSLGVPIHAYWGIHTKRALNNFPITGERVNPSLIKALAMVKKACCQANHELGYLDLRKFTSITSACDEIATGRLADQFPVDALQGGAGTSTNMNINEVIANRAMEIMGGVKGDYEMVHPLHDANLHQSTNDVYPTAIKIAAILGLRRLSDAIALLQDAFQAQEKSFGAIIKIGRTELQEAVPITLGAEFSAFSEAFSRDRWRTFKCEERLRVVNIGGTAVGTGLTAPRDYIFLVIEKLREVTGLSLARGENIMGETANTDAFVEVSGILKAHASNLIKIANDLRLLNLLGEIHLPALQAGSSIMPGKVNPVLLEAVMQTGIKVIANDVIITEVASRGTLQINEFQPLLAHALLESLTLLENINMLLAKHVSAITADTAVCRGYFDRSSTIITALLPDIGYEKAMELLKDYGGKKAKTTPLSSPGGRVLSTENDIASYLMKRLEPEIVTRAFSPYNLTALGFRK